MEQEQKVRLIRYLIDNSGARPSQDENGSIDFSRDVNSRLRYQYAVRSLINEYFDFHQLGVTARDLRMDMIGIATDMASPSDSIDDFYPVSGSVDDDGLVEIFERKINAVKEDIGRGNEITFTVWFPWQISWQNAPSAFEVYGLSLERVTDSEWSEKLDELREDPDAFDSARIKNKTEESEFDYWKTTINAKSPSNAFSYFSSAFNLLSAKINHSKYYFDGNTLNRREGPSSGHIDRNERWSVIRKPFAVLWEDDRTDETIGVDRGYQGCNLYYDKSLEQVDIDYNEIEERYEKHPSFSWTEETKPRLRDALLGYQNGLIATDQVHSFFSFWRVLEELTLAERQNKDSVIDKALFSTQVVTNGDYDQVIDQIAEEIWETRNNWVHDPSWTGVAESQEIVSKLLADAMIEFHITSGRELDETVMRRVFKWGIESNEKRSEVKEALEIVDGF